MECGGKRERHTALAEGGGGHGWWESRLEEFTAKAQRARRVAKVMECGGKRERHTALAGGGGGHGWCWEIRILLLIEFGRSLVNRDLAP